MLVVGCCLLFVVSVCGLPCLSFVVFGVCSLLFVRCLVVVDMRCLLADVCWLLLVVCRLSCAVCRVLLVDCCSLFVVCCLPFVCCLSFVVRCCVSLVVVRRSLLFVGWYRLLFIV